MKLCLVPQSYPTLCNCMDYSPPGSSVHRDSLGKNTRVDSISLLQGIFPTQRQPKSPALQVDSLQSEPSGKSCITHQLLLAIYFIYGNMCFSATLSNLSHPLLPHTVSRVCSLCLYHYSFPANFTSSVLFRKFVSCISVFS